MSYNLPARTFEVSHTSVNVGGTAGEHAGFQALSAAQTEFHDRIAMGRQTNSCRFDGNEVSV